MKTSKWFSLVTMAATIGFAGYAQAQDATIKFGHLNNTDHPISMGVKKFAELVAAKSGGKMKVQEFPSNQLGNEQQQTSALQGGVQEMQSPATTSIATIVKEFGVIDYPFSISSFAQADALLDGPVGKALLDKLPEKGLVGLAYWDLGFRNVTNSKRPIAKAEDLDGIKIRVIPNPVFLETFKAFKANPVPMSFNELYTALETKTVDGQENPFAVILSNKFYEVQKFVSATNHVYATNIILVSKKFYDKLSPADQKILRDAAVEARDYQRKLSREAAASAVEQLKAKGMQYNDVSPAEQQRMQAIAKPVWEKVSTGLDPTFMKLYASEMERISKMK